MHSLNAERVYTKTEKGREEVARRQYGLSARQRQLLILIDGSKSVAEVRKLVVHSLFMEDMQALLQAGFIVPGEKDDATITPEAQPGQAFMEHASSQPDRLRRLKEFMIGASRMHLGLLGAGLVDYIERADDFAKLALVVGQWHLALRESKRGSTLADTYLQQVRMALHDVSQADCQAA